MSSKCNLLVSSALRGSQALFAIVVLGLSVTLVKDHNNHDGIQGYPNVPTILPLAAAIGSLTLVAAVFSAVVAWTNFLREYMEMLVDGNMYHEDALKIADLTEEVLKPQPLPPSQWVIKRALMLPPGSNFMYSRPLKDPSNVNHCIDYMLYVGDKNEMKRYSISVVDRIKFPGDAQFQFNRIKDLKA